MRYFSIILSAALIFAAVNCGETEKVEEVEEDIPKEVCELNLFISFSPNLLHPIMKFLFIHTASFRNSGCDHKCAKSVELFAKQQSTLSK